MPNGLITPTLILEVVEAGEDAVITQEEFSGLIGVIMGIFVGVFTTMFIGKFLAKIAKG